MANESVDDFEREQLDLLKRRISRLLTEHRPDRYAPGSARFLDDIAGRVADEVPATMARKMLARDLVGQLEGGATRRVNRFLKGLAGARGQFTLPVDWAAYRNDPVAIESPVVNDDGEVVGFRRERVALRAMTGTDWHNFSANGRQVAQERFDAEIAMYDAADWCAAEQGINTFHEWAERICPTNESGAA